MNEIISHIYQDSEGHWVIQSNEEHSVGVAKLAAQFTGDFRMSKWGKVLGLLHDKGKETKAFQGIEHIEEIIPEEFKLHERLRRVKLSIANEGKTAWTCYNNSYRMVHHICS